MALTIEDMVILIHIGHRTNADGSSHAYLALTADADKADANMMSDNEQLRAAGVKPADRIRED